LKKLEKLKHATLRVMSEPPFKKNPTFQFWQETILQKVT